MAGGLLVVLAHPDDESLVGGTMARCVDEGAPVTMLCATRGEVGEIAPGTGATPETLGPYREQELRDACAVLGVADVRFLPYRDSGMAGTPENDDPRSLHQAPPDAVVGLIVRAIRELRPDAIVTWDETGGYGHPDHVKVHQCARAAFDAAADPAQDVGEGAPWRTPALYYGMIPIAAFESAMQEMGRRGLDLGEPPGDVDEMLRLDHRVPNCVIDVSAQYERKMRALAAHRTQVGSFGPLAKMPEDLQRSIFSREHLYRVQPPVADRAVLDAIFGVHG
ncbi:MAG: PIG-L family deacetylase [Chloroflexota bacterium]|nr:PIG-L family deacetylase [Chloroflexota bacterium]